MMKHIILTFSLLVSGSSWGDAYHTFTNQQGQTVTAKIVAISSYTGKVQLQRKNGKKVWVERDIFSSGDQEFINAWKEKGSATPTSKSKDSPTADSVGTDAQPLSKKKIRNIAKQYKKAWENKDYALWSSLLDLHKGHHLLNESSFSEHDIPSVSVRSVEGHNVFIEYKIKHSYTTENVHSGLAGLVFEHNGWLQVLPDGKIKYTPFLFQHPVRDAMDQLSYLFPFYLWSDDIHSKARLFMIEGSLATLNRMKIPCFGYDINASDSRRNDAFEQIVDWMVENHESWDESEPKIPCPEDLFKEKMEWFKKRM